jgi:hypothetical protein
VDQHAAGEHQIEATVLERQIEGGALEDVELGVARAGPGDREPLRLDAPHPRHAERPQVAQVPADVAADLQRVGDVEPGEDRPQRVDPGRPLEVVALGVAGAELGAPQRELRRGRRRRGGGDGGGGHGRLQR